MSVPDITHLQCIVLNALLRQGELSGRDLRGVLVENGIRRSTPAFYQLMARLEDGNYVEGWYEDRIIDKQKFRERRYRLGGSGEAALEEVLNFYYQMKNARAAFGAGGA